MKNTIATLTLLLVLAGCSTSPDSDKEACPIDREREARIESEATATLFDGEPVRINVAPGNDGFEKNFLGIWTEGDNDKPVVVLAHGPQRHIATDIIASTALELNQLGYGTLSLQLPVLNKDCQNAEDYPSTFPESFARIDAAAKWLQSKEMDNLALFGHWVGNAYLANTKDAPYQAWIVNGLTGRFGSMGDNEPRVLDVFGEKGNSFTLRSAWMRRIWLWFRDDGRQVIVPGADQNFADQTDDLAKAIDGFLRN
jgi:hypothetical protein